jgi:hypothetical protein
MPGPERYFFEIPIYRCPIDRHTKEMEKDKLDWLEPSQEVKNSHPEYFCHAKRFWESHRWYPWRYNEVIGWLRLFVFGSQIRGELWYTKAKCILPKPKKLMFSRGDVFLRGFHPRQTDTEILTELTAELVKFQKSKRLKGRFLDLECFFSIAPSVRWRKLLGFESTGSYGTLST